MKVLWLVPVPLINTFNAHLALLVMTLAQSLVYQGAYYSQLLRYQQKKTPIYK